MATHQTVIWMSKTFYEHKGPVSLLFCTDKDEFAVPNNVQGSVYGSLRIIPSTECAPVIREPVSNFADTGPRDSDPPHFKTSCYPAIPPELHRGGKCSSCARWPTIAPFAPHHCGRRLNYRRQKSDFASLMVRWSDTSELEPHVFSDLHPAEEPGRYHPSSLIRWPRMDRRSAFRAFVLLACVIIYSDVLCPVGAYLYNNRYAG